MEVEINGVDLIPGKDFIVSPDSRGIKGKGILIQKDSTHFVDARDRIVVELQDKLTWSAEQQVLNYTLILKLNVAQSAARQNRARRRWSPT